MNPDVFAKPDLVMENIFLITTEIKKKLKPAFPRNYSKRVLTLLPTRDGNYYYIDSAGYMWRTYFFIEDSICCNQIDSLELVEIVAETFARFQIYLFDIELSSLHETIPNFHNGYDRFQKFKNAVKENPLGRVKNCQREIDLILESEKDFYVLEDFRRSGAIPTRITHNDTKINNLLIDKKGEEGFVCFGFRHCNAGESFISILEI